MQRHTLFLLLRCNQVTGNIGHYGLYDCDLQCYCKQENGVEEKYYEVTCGTTWLYYLWISLTVIYKFILNTAGLVLAFRNRKVPLEALNDSSFSTIIIYVTTALVIMTVLDQALRSNILDVNIGELMFSVFIVLISVNFLGLTFISKVNNNKFDSLA